MEDEDSSFNAYLKDRSVRIAEALSQKDLDTLEAYMRPTFAILDYDAQQHAIHETTIAIIRKVAGSEYEQAKEYSNEQLMAVLMNAFDFEMRKRGVEPEGRS